MPIENRKIGITDTTLRDAHQSLLATRMRTEDMLPIAEKMDNMGFHSLEVWGGATFDTTMRFLNESPWERLRQLKEVFKKTKLQMLLRGQNLVGYRHYADDVVEAFIERSAANGIDIFRVFDALNDIRNMAKAMEEVRKNNKHAQATISYTTGPIYDLEYYVKLSKQLKDIGADSICIKDMAGILTPYGAYDLVKAIKEEVNLPIQMHTHYTSGMGAMMYLKAIEAGADVIDTANSALAMGTSQPATETMLAVLEDSGYKSDVKLQEVVTVTDYFKDIREKYHQYDLYQGGVDVNVLRYQVPGGMLSNFISQLTEQKALHKLDEVLQEVPKVRADLGYPPLVTPSSQIVGTQAVLNVLMGNRYKMVTNEVKNYLKGQYGNPPGNINEEIRKQIIGEQEFITCRPADLLEPQLPSAKEEFADVAKDLEELLMCIIFPQVGKPFLKGEIVAETLIPKGVVQNPEPQAAPPKVEPVKSLTNKPLGEVNHTSANLAKNLRNTKGQMIAFHFNGNIDEVNIHVDKDNNCNMEQKEKKDQNEKE